jgi:3-hexulose-6-phosphate synthase/6-phospho-3-hexuloisomerase
MVITSRQLQIALDFIDLDAALEMARKVVAGGADIIEVGTPLIKSCGLSSVSAIREAVGAKSKILADMKTMDVGYLEVKMAAERGADISTVLASASEATIRAAVQAGLDHGVDVAADLIGVGDVVQCARRLEELGVNSLCVHSGIDELGRSKPTFQRLKEVFRSVDLPISSAGGINLQNVIKAFHAGASIVVVGRAVTLSQDPRAETQKLAEIAHNYAGERLTASNQML